MHKAAVSVFGEHAGDFKNAHAVLLAVEVVLQHFHQPADERRAHHGILRRQRVLQADGVVVGGKIAFPSLIDKGVADHFAVAARGHFVVHSKTRAAGFGQRQHFQTACGVVVGNVFVAVHAADFFDQIGLDFDVEAEARRGRLKALGGFFRLQTEFVQNGFDLFGGDVHAQYFGDAAHAQVYPFFRWQSAHGFHHFACRTAADLQHQLGGAFDSIGLQTVVHTALEAERRVRAEAVLARFARNHGGREPRRFQDDVARVV